MHTALSKLIHIMLVALRLRRRLLSFPKLWNVFIITLTHSTLLVVAEALLSPERTFTLDVDLVSPEKGSSFQRIKNRSNRLIE